MRRRLSAYLVPAAPISYVALVALSNLTGGQLGSVLEELIIVAGFATCMIALYLWVDRVSLRKQLQGALEEKQGLQEVVARKASLEVDLEVTSAVRELALVTGNTNDLDQALAASARLTHDLVHDVSGGRHGVEVGIFLRNPKGGPPSLRAVANAAGPRTGRKARARDLVGAIPEGALAGAADGEHAPPLVRNSRILLLQPIENAATCLGALYVGLPQGDSDTEHTLGRLGQLLRRFSSHIAHSVQKFALYDEATLDALTGLLTKRQYLQRLATASESARSGKPLSLIVIDLDHFKSINDTHGHATGDVVLKRVAAMLSSVIRDDDLAFRFGGEEMVVLTDAGLAAATMLAERIRKATADLVVSSTKGERLHVAASLGVAAFEPHMKSGQELFERADRAVYASKEGGRNRVSVWTGSGPLSAKDSGYLDGPDGSVAASA